MGWGSYGLYGHEVCQEKMLTVMDAVAARTNKVDGVLTSLCDLGYCVVGLDDFWQQ